MFSLKHGWRLARQAFATTAAYDSAIANTLEARASAEEDSASEMPETLRIVARRAATLRYGENPHQQAAVYVDGTGTGIAAVVGVVPVVGEGVAAPSPVT